MAAVMFFPPNGVPTIQKSVANKEEQETTNTQNVFTFLGLRLCCLIYNYTELNGHIHTKQRKNYEVSVSHDGDRPITSLLSE